jgi:hypothetical protein
MKVPDHPSRIGNTTVRINGTDYPILELTIIPGAYSDIKLLNFNWTFEDFSPSLMRLQVIFENPLYVSSKALYPDKIQVKVHGF